MRNYIDIPIPAGSRVELTIDPGVPAGEEFNADVEPDKEGFKFEITYFILDLTNAPDVEANIIATTEEGDMVLLAENLQGGQKKVIDASDFGHTLFDKFTLYVKVVNSPTSQNVAVLRYGGRLVTPWL